MENSRVLALGFFDGVHIGHGALLQKTRQTADRLGISACALTFDAHPMTQVLRQPMPLLSTLDERRMLMQTLYGIDELIIAHFDEAFMHMSWQRFLEAYLLETLQARFLVCGSDFRFGFQGEGTPEKLQSTCRTLGLGCEIVPPVCLHGQAVSSTHIRQLLLQGDLPAASELLGHPHLICGSVQNGVLSIRDGVLLPPEGRYEAVVGEKAGTVSIQDGRVLLSGLQNAQNICVWLNNRIDK